MNYLFYLGDWWDDCHCGPERGLENFLLRIQGQQQMIYTPKLYLFLNSNLSLTSLTHWWSYRMLHESIAIKGLFLLSLQCELFKYIIPWYFIHQVMLGALPLVMDEIPHIPKIPKEILFFMLLKSCSSFHISRDKQLIILV